MDMASGFRKSLVILTLSAAGVVIVPSGALGQVRERDVTVAGPRGRTVERHLESRNGPNGLTREMTVTRPGGTYQREAHFGGPPPFAPPPRRDVIVERNVFVNRGNPGINPWASFGLGAALGTGAGVVLDRTLLAPRPPVYVVPQPMYVAPVPPPTVIYNPPVAYQAAPPTVVIDPVAQQISRFTSSYAPSRREAAAVLGRLGDARAVPALVERLKLDTDKSVRINAANSLAQIGDPKAAVFLERSSIYDKKQEVRDASASALTRMPREVPPQRLDSAERIPPPPMPDGGLRR